MLKFYDHKWGFAIEFQCFESKELDLADIISSGGGYQA